MEGKAGRGGCGGRRFGGEKGGGGGGYREDYNTKYIKLRGKEGMGGGVQEEKKSRAVRSERPLRYN